jgi:hypothetical protein
MTATMALHDEKLIELELLRSALIDYFAKGKLDERLNITYAPHRAPVAPETAHDALFIRRHETGSLRLLHYKFIHDGTDETKYAAVKDLAFSHAWYGEGPTATLASIYGWALSRAQLRPADADLLQAVFFATANANQPAWIAYYDDRTNAFAYGSGTMAQIMCIALIALDPGVFAPVHDSLFAAGLPFGGASDAHLVPVGGGHPEDPNMGERPGVMPPWQKRWEADTAQCE